MATDLDRSDSDNLNSNAAAIVEDPQTNEINDEAIPMFIFISIVAVCSLVLCAFICSKLCRSVLQSRGNLMVRANSLNLPSTSSTHTQSATPALSLISVGFTVTCVCLYTLQNILDPFAYYTRFMQPSHNNNYSTHITYHMVWISAKFSFYALLMHRYYVIFDAGNSSDPFLLYKKLCIFGMFCTVLLTQLLLYFAFFVVYYEFMSEHFGNTDLDMQYACISVLCLDLLLIAVLAYLFTTSILKLVIQIQDEREKESMLTHRQDITNKYKHRKLAHDEPDIDDCFMHEYIHDDDLDFKAIKPSFSMTSDQHMLHPENNNNNNNNALINQVTFHVRDCSNMSHMSHCSIFDVSTDTAQTDLFQSIASSPRANNRMYGETPQHLPMGTVNILNLHATDSTLPPQLRPHPTISSIRHKYESTASSMPEYMPSAKVSHAANDWNDEEDMELKKEKPATRTMKYEDHYNKKQMKLLNMTTRIVLTSFIALISSFLYQLALFIGFEMNNYSRLVWFNYTWCLDGLITMLCVYLQTEIAKPLYQVLCIRCLKFHQCSFKLLHSIAVKRIYTIHHSQSAILMVAQSSGDSCNQSPTLEAQKIRIEINDAVNSPISK